MKKIIYFTLITVLFLGCEKETPLPPKPLPVDLNITSKIISKKLPNTYLIKSDFSELPSWSSEKYDEALDSFINSCKTSKTKKLYSSLCQKAKMVIDSKSFFEEEFDPYMIDKRGSKRALLTGYYEAELKGSLTKDDVYKYPVYTTPSDLIIVDLASIYPKLKHYRLRGKLKGNRVIPYDPRATCSGENCGVICYTDSKIDLFFLEIQGSGRVTLKNGKTIFIGYANQNGHRYRAIGRYLVKIGALELKDVSLQSIREWLEKHPSRVDEVLNYNKSVVYFKERQKSATGALGLELTPNRSVAVDRKYIPLGSMLYLSSKIGENNVSRVVMAQDTGGAIKGEVRADMFLGYGKRAMNLAGELKSPLKLWLFLPKDREL
jgi:membrane-bound lytic murein transglycosylase A